MTDSDRSVAAIADRLRAGQEAPHRLALRVEDCAFEIRSNSAKLIDILADYYRDWAADSNKPAEIRISFIETPSPELDLPFVPFPPGPGKTRIKDELLDLEDGRLARKPLTGMVFLFGHSHNIGVGPCLTNTNQVVNFINNRFIQRTLDRGHLLCHAAGVARGDVGLAIAGTAGAGKSTLALHMMRQDDVDLVSNDRLMIRRSGNDLIMLGLPKLPRVNPGTIMNNPMLTKMLTPDQMARYEGMSPDDLWSLEEKYDADINACFGPGRMRLRAKMAAFMVLDWRRDAGRATFRRVELEEHPRLLDAIMKRAGAHYWAASSRIADAAAPEAYLAALKGCPIVAVSGGIDFETAVAEGLALLGRTARDPIVASEEPN